MAPACQVPLAGAPGATGISILEPSRLAPSSQRAGELPADLGDYHLQPAGEIGAVLDTPNATRKPVEQASVGEEQKHPSGP
jgi:hypothetical protein